MRDFMTKTAIVAVVFSCLTVGSFFAFDYKNVKDKVFCEDYWNNSISNQMDREYKSVLKENGKFDSIKINSTNLSIAIVESEEDKYELYSKIPNADFRKYINISTSKDDGGFECKVDEIKSTNKNVFKIVFYTTDPKSLAVKIDSVNGSIDVDGVLKNLDVDFTNGAINLNAEESYNANIETINGIVSINFKKIDAVISVEAVNGVIKFLDESRISVGGVHEFNKKIGNGRDEIDIEMVNGEVYISE
ncbi:hypothetical protein [Peptoniphilus sp. oral taxon 386]|uniref:hypothetical protein n=1 Tax=Peptoniphilus sp. oral taxon 386 TaxID=652713 RepID=UPI0001DA998E|nr:hypothetical protein [Peptoniphilus sp. oral taxon 386]EFI41424.1 hypothetical protein HMPREF0629_00043 [Peptoniphilus sp. oral taxon 386 str. F0131]